MKKEKDQIVVAFISHDGSLVGGASRSLLGLIDGLRDCGMNPLVICPFRGGLTSALEERGVPYIIVPFRPWLKRDGFIPMLRAIARIAFNILLLPVVIIKLSLTEVDIIYTNSSVTPVGALSAAVLRKPHIWHIREIPRKGLGMSHGLGDRIMRNLMDRADALVCVSTFIKEACFHDVAAPLYVVRNGLFTRKQLQEFSTDLESHRQDDGYVFGCFGHIRRSKNQEEAIRALHMVSHDHPKARLLLVGSGEEKYLAELKLLCAELGLEEKVDFRGYVDDPLAIMKKCDATIICSRNEALPRVVIESMALGKPVIGCRSGGVAEVIKEMENGLLYDNSVESLASCMRALMDDRNLALRLGEGGRKGLSEEFLIDVSAGKIADLVRDILGKRLETDAKTSKNKAARSGGNKPQSAP